MPRADLLALTEDDLTALTNRGTVKRAQRELEEIAVSCEIEESAAGDVKVNWSDGIVCEIPAGVSLRDARCSSGAGGISRHLVRSVLAYQRRQSPAQTSAPPAAWDPGATITDAMLEQQYRKADLTRARARFASGVLVELIRSPKPLARFLDDPCTIRFMVPRDLRYLHSDCSPQQLGVFAPVAVWAFRQLPADQTAGLISIQTAPPPIPIPLLDELEQSLRELALAGLATVGDVWKQCLARLDERCRGEGLVWPAEIVAELGEEYERYHQHDARFSLDRMVDLLGELLVRADAIRAGRDEIPQMLVRGTGADRLSELASARFIGLGCGVRTTRKSTTITAFSQDADTGTVVGVVRDFANSEADDAEPRDFAKLARSPVVRGVSLAALGAGQLLLKSAKRTPSHRLVLPRGMGVSVNPQAFAWEKLREPLLVESFAELTALLSALPPPSLRSRRVTEDLFVCAIHSVAEVWFNEAEQAVVAKLEDAAGGTATLVHPFTSRSAEGTESLLAMLQNSSAKLRFVSGHARPSAQGLVIRPLCAVFEDEERRIAIQPWIEGKSTSEAKPMSPLFSANGVQRPIPGALALWQAAIGELWLAGTRRANAPLITAWQEAAQRLEAVGLVKLGETATKLAAEIGQRLGNPGYTGENAAAQLLHTSLLSRLVEECGE